MPRLTVFRFMLILGVALICLPVIVGAQDPDIPDDLIVPLVPPENGQGDLDDLIVPLVPPENGQGDLDDLIVPLVPPENGEENLDDLLVPLVPTPKPVDRNKFKNALPQDWMMPIEGIWTRHYGEESVITGDCTNLLKTHGDGISRNTFDPDDPAYQAQLCASSVAGVVFLDNVTYRADVNGGASNVYYSDIWVDEYSGSSNQHIMSMLDQNTIEVQFISKDATCTITSTVLYKLYIPGQMFGCAAQMPQVIRPEDPTEEEEELVEEIVKEEGWIIDPIKTGRYSVKWLPLDQECDAAYAPTFTQAEVSQTSFDDVSLIINGEKFDLFGDGKRGSFSLYADNLNASLDRRFNDDFNIVWQTSSEDKRESCYAQGIVKLEEATTDQPAFAANGSSSASGSLPESGDYAVTWAPIEGIECNSAQLAAMPDFTNASITVNEEDNSFTIAADALTYEVTEMTPGMWMSIEFKDDNSGMSLNFEELTASGVKGTYTYFDPDGGMCAVALNIAQ